MLWNSIVKQNNYFPEAKAAHSCDKIGSTIFIFGGWNGRKALNTLETYDMIKEEWQLIKSTGEIASPRNNHASCSLNDYIYIHGGHDGEAWLDDFYLFDTKRLFWKKIICNQHAPKARACHTLSRIGRKLYMYGGFNGKNSFGDFEIFDTQTQIWMNINLHILSSQTDSFCNDYISDIFIPTARSAHTANVLNKKIYIFGGHFENFHLNDLVIFDSVKNQWDCPEVKGTIPNGLRGHTTTFIHNKLYIFGGYDGDKRNNSIYRIRLEEDEYVFMKIKNNKDDILPRQRHTAAIRNNNIIFFGGFDGNKWLNCLDELNVQLLENNVAKENSTKNLKNDFRLLVNNKEFSDIIFVVQNELLYAHKCILIARSEFFRNMFSDHMIENKSNIINIDSFDSKTFSFFLEYLYLSDINCKELEEVVKLYKIADSYSCISLKNNCEEIISFMITGKNVVVVLILGHKFNSYILENKAIEYIIQNRKEILLSNTMIALIDYPSLMIKILIKL